MSFVLKSAFCLLLILFAAPAYAASPPKTYEGKVGKARAEFSLSWEQDGSVSGSYFYPDMKPFRYGLRGNNRVQGVLELNEYTGPELSARLFLKKSIEAGNIVWRGTMKNTDGRIFEMHFSRRSDATPAGSSSKIRDIQIPVKTTHDLDTAPGYSDGGEDGYIERVDFPAKLISSTTSPDGVTTATLQLEPATDGDEMNDMPAKHRVIPNPSRITVSSKKLSRSLAENMDHVSIAPMGRHQGKVCLLVMSSNVAATEARRLDSGKTQLTIRNPKTKGTYTLTIDDFGDYGPGGSLEWKPGTSGIGERTWQKSTSSWVGKPNLYFGDGGGSVFLDGKGWHLEGNGAGPGGADYSYLETKSTRGEFD